MISYVVSACLVGQCCRYDGKSNFVPDVYNLLEQGKAIAVCPEVLGGLPTPRDPSELCVLGNHAVYPHNSTTCDVLHLPRYTVEGMELVASSHEVWRVMTKNGHDVTAAFILGAQKALHLAVQAGCTKAIIKSRSPSCGPAGIYDGSFSKKLVPGMGVWATMLNSAGFTLYSEENFPSDCE